MEHDLVAAGTEREVLRRKAPLSGLSVAPDGRYLALLTRDQASKESLLLVVPIAGGEPRALLRLQAPQALGGNFTAWTPDSRSILVRKNESATEDREHWLVPLAGGQPRKVDFGRLGANVRMHPDGSQLVFTTGGNSKFEVWVMENFLPTLKESK